MTKLDFYLNIQTLFELIFGRRPNNSHIRIFGCQIWAPTAKPHGHTIGPHRQQGIYLGFDSPSIIRYLISETGSILKVRFAHSMKIIFLKCLLVLISHNLHLLPRKPLQSTSTLEHPSPKPKLKNFSTSRHSLKTS